MDVPAGLAINAGILVYTRRAFGLLLCAILFVADSAGDLGRGRVEAHLPLARETGSVRSREEQEPADRVERTNNAAEMLRLRRGAGFAAGLLETLIYMC